MTLNNSQQAIIDHRRRRVAHHRLRGRTQREIIVALAAEGTLNPETGGAWGLGTINRDLKALEDEWRAEALADLTGHKALMLAELRETARTAWEGGDLAIVLRSLKQQAELLGLDEPQQLYSDFNINVLYGNERINGQS